MWSCGLWTDRGPWTLDCVECKNTKTKCKKREFHRKVFLMVLCVWVCHLCSPPLFSSVKISSSRYGTHCYRNSKIKKSRSKVTRQQKSRPPYLHKSINHTFGRRPNTSWSIKSPSKSTCLSEELSYAAHWREMTSTQPWKRWAKSPWI